MTNTLNNLERLQNWYHATCDGDWEHSYGIHVTTLDNPGWSVDIDLTETDLEDRELLPVQIERSQVDWIFVSRTPAKFQIRCGPHNFDEGLKHFCDWAEAIGEPE
jgi:hypothetical protein